MLDHKKRKSLRDRRGEEGLLIPTPASISSLMPLDEPLPATLFLLPVAYTTLFPGMMVPLILPEGKLAKTLEKVMEEGGVLGVILNRDPEASTVAAGPTTSISGLPVEGVVSTHRATDRKRSLSQTPFYRYGVAARILKKINLPDNQVSVLLSGLERFEIKELLGTDPHFVASVKYIYEDLEKGTELEALIRSCLSRFKQLSRDNPLISEEVKVALVNIDGPGKLADFMASVLIRDVKDYQDFLAQGQVKERLHSLLLLLKKEEEVQSVQRRISDEINQKVSSAQRDFYLNEQLKLIQKELGRSVGDRNRMIEKFRARLNDKKLPEEAKVKIEEEIEKLTTLAEQSSEYSVSINYLDWLTALPWGVRSKESYDLKKAREVLDKDHYGLKEVKERILEFLAVRKLKQTSEGSIICFVGPPGTGKTSLGKSIARALNRKFIRFSVGGMRDEAEIKGHRRTYVGAMPGKLIQGLKRIGTQNPVFLIDEIDKIGTSYAGGDPSSALLELLDPEQNTEFLDHYLDLSFDCSDVFFVTTANSLDSIPSALLDRMEIISLSGYTDNEKIKIARKYLIPKQLKKNAIKGANVKFPDKGLKLLVQQYARESGVRVLERQISRVCRKAAYRIATGKNRPVRVQDIKSLEKLLGLPPFPPEPIENEKTIGTATGLAWTQYGGDVLTVESAQVEGRGGFVLTGSLGDVMQESANIAYTFVRGKALQLELPKKYFERYSLHLHVPAGATPKDGPSAGITMAASLYSLVTQKPLKRGIAMTGELTLTGKVLPVGGIKEKLLAAKRCHIKTVLIPKQNTRDLKEIEPEVKKGLKFILVDRMEECLKHLF
ncbi:MAG: endopeptidase La [Bdellovibrionales bacterium]|nr:endopeptidase La [Bdellovibrionales bacterium]